REEIAARERVEAGEALVEQEQARRLRERGDEQRAGGLAAREVLEGALERDLPGLREALGALRAPARVLPREEAVELARRHPRGVVRRIGHVADELAQLAAVAHRIEAEHADRALFRLQEPEQEPQQRALPLPVLAEQDGHATRRQLEAHVLQHARLAEA